ncbi:MAG: TonB-dependent receptor [Bacteroides sp.]|nr:TonB-dependent receptor [Bacteroides sp.]
MNKKNFIKGTALPVALFFSALVLVPAYGIQPASAAVNTTQQQGTIRGTVVDSQGEPVIGANVVAEGNTLGTITDFDGVFTLNVNPGTKLTISFVGYQTVTMAAKSDMKVVLTDDYTILSEVEVVAYGTQKKVTMTGAISSVKAEELTRTSVGSVANVLGGAMTGLTTVQYSGEPGSDAAEIFIRGKATFATDGYKPLIQVDGVERSMNDIDPNEIESISILKDASATAVFGVRGANGVVLITTKRGREGKARISFNTSASVLMPTKMVKQASAYDYATFYNAMCRNDGIAEVFSDDVLEKFRTGSDPIRFPSINWVDYLMKDATLQTQHNLNITGGIGNVRYFISAGAYTQGGLFKEFDLPYSLGYQYNRFNYRSNLDIDVTKTTTLSFNIAGNVDNSDKPRTSQGTSGMIKNIYYATPFKSAGFVDGKLVYTTTDYNDIRLPFTGDVDPLTYYGSGFSSSSNNKLNIDLALNQQLDFLTKGLSFRIKGAYNSSFTVNKVGSGGTVMSYNPILLDDGSVGLRPVDGSKDTDISYSYSTGRARDWYVEAAFDYGRTFGDHTVGGLVLYNQSKEYYPSTYSDIPHGYVGIAGRVTYDWKSRYMAEFNIGYNGSENFAPGKRFAAFPAVSAGWILSEEKFFRRLKPVISFLKLRVSMGLVGNDNTNSGRFLYLADPYNVNLSNLANRVTVDRDGSWGYLFGVDNATVSLGAREASKNNADVTWEKALKQNYGIDINFFDDRLRATADYYFEDRKDILLSDGTAPSMLGFTTPLANLGEVHSWGWELSLKWNDQINNNFRYWVGVNLSYNQNKIVEMKESPKDYEFQYQKGHRIGSRSQYLFWRYYDEGTPALYEQTFNRPFPEYTTVLQNGDAVYADLNGDRVLDSNDMSYDYGYTDDPEYMIGLNLGFTWKNFEVSTQWTGAWNVSRMISDVFQRPFVASSGAEYGGLLVYHLTNTWTEENPSQNAKYPRATWNNASNNYATSTLYEQDSKYLRLKTMQIAYNFQFPWMKKINLSTCQLAFSGYNLLTFTPYIWGDPEARATNAPSYPLNRTYTLSLKLGF